MKFREGDYIETEEGLFFHVKGILHPANRAIAFLRYVPDSRGDRKKGGKRYRKIYSLNDRFEYLQSNYPKYILNSDRLDRRIQAVPKDSIENIYRPEEKLEDLMNKDKQDPVEKTALKLSKRILKHAKIKRRNLGITGSVLLGLHRPNSDIDLVTYGEENGRIVHPALNEMRERKSLLKPYANREALRIAEFRWNETGLPIEKLVELESRKILHGLVDGRDFFMRLVKNPKDVDREFKDFRYVSGKRARIRGKISNDEESIFTPNRYAVQNVTNPEGERLEIENLFSFRGRFAEQAHKGERVEAYGQIERVIHKGTEEHSRLMLGRPRDYMIPESLSPLE